MAKPTLSVSGYRGIWGDSLTPEIAIRFAKAFAMFTKANHRSDLWTDSEKQTTLGPTYGATILIGRDGRESGPTISSAIIPELEKLGINVIYGDLLPTPTMILACKKYKYDGGIIITASHNPIEYNGLKFITKDARLTNEEERDSIKRNFETPLLSEEGAGGGDSNEGHPLALNGHSPFAGGENFIKEHVDEILKHIDVEAIRARKFKVAVDMINASACAVDPYLFEQLGATLIPINNIPNGKFAHRPEPVKENLEGICELVKDSGADIGFAHDPDADRLVIINEKGEYISEEYTLGFGIEAVLSKNPGRNVVINMSTSQMSADITENHGGKCFRTKVGEANVFAGIDEHNAIIGGEGGSGCIYPTINNCRDGFVSLSLALELLAKRNQTVSELVESLPKYFMKKDKFSIEGKNMEELYQKLKSKFPDGKINELDGLRLDFPNQSWIHIRPSITEPIVRFFGEAKTQSEIDALFAAAKSAIA